jgi:hypothetical protein
MISAHQPPGLRFAKLYYHRFSTLVFDCFTTYFQNFQVAAAARRHVHPERFARPPPVTSPGNSFAPLQLINLDTRLHGFKKSVNTPITPPPLGA